MKRFLLCLALALGVAVPAFAQSNLVIIGAKDPSSPTSTIFAVGDSTNNAIRVSIVANSTGGSGGTSSNLGAAVPTAATAAGFSDGTNLQAARVVDADTGAGTAYVFLNNLVRRASGGPVELLGQATMANSLPVAIASDQAALTVSGTVTSNQGTAGSSAWLTKLEQPTSATVSSVAGSATSVSLLASNAARKGMTVFNDSTSDLYMKFGATASTSSFTVKIAGGGFYQMPVNGYAGAVDGIWSSATGNARLTEW